MAIVRVDPPNSEAINILQVDSDAADDRQAMREIEEWAARNGFVRTNEHWLRRALVGPDRTPVFRGICYRLTPDEVANIEERHRLMVERTARQTAYVHEAD